MVGTAFKIFFMDPWRLGQLYRMASFIGLAAVLILHPQRPLYGIKVGLPVAAMRKNPELTGINLLVVNRDGHALVSETGSSLLDESRILYRGGIYGYLVCSGPEQVVHMV